jgi:hypothetical protein
MKKILLLSLLSLMILFWCQNEAFSVTISNDYRFNTAWVSDSQKMILSTSVNKEANRVFMVYQVKSATWSDLFKEDLYIWAYDLELDEISHSSFDDLFSTYLTSSNDNIIQIFSHGDYLISTVKTDQFTWFIWEYEQMLIVCNLNASW